MTNYSNGLAPAGDGFAVVLREAVENLKTNDRCNVLSADGLSDVLTEAALFRGYMRQLTEGLSASTAETFEVLAENAKFAMLQEASLSNIQPVSALNLPILRKAWPRIGVKEAIPTQALKVPEITVAHLIAYMIDPSTGAKLELPKALKALTDANSSQRRVDSALRTLPLNAVDVMPSGCPVSGGYTLDPVFAVTTVLLSVTDAAGANPEDKTVKVFDGRSDTLSGGNFRFTVKSKHSSGHETADTVFGYVDGSAGVVTATSLNAAGNASQTAAKVKKIGLSGKIDSSSNRKSTEISYDLANTKITVGTGEHFSANMPIEWLQDQLAMFGVDGTLKVIDLITEVIAQKVDIEGRNFLTDSFDRIASDGQVNYERTFDVHPGGNYAHSPTEWIAEIRRVIDNLAQTMRNETNMAGGMFVILGNPMDVELIPNAAWTFSAGDGEREGVSINYSLGAVKGANRYTLFASQNIPQGALYLFFIPQQEDHKTYAYFPYTFNVMKTSEGFTNPNQPHVPGVMMTKRHRFHEFKGVIGKINILSNDGTSPA